MAINVYKYVYRHYNVVNSMQLFLTVHIISMTQSLNLSFISSNENKKSNKITITTNIDGRARNIYRLV